MPRAYYLAAYFFVVGFNMLCEAIENIRAGRPADSRPIFDARGSHRRSVAR